LNQTINEHFPDLVISVRPEEDGGKELVVMRQEEYGREGRVQGVHEVDINPKP
jgi:hypothetical protein